ncbi:MAG: DUF1566 domain-containing protein [Proteobacteria bacterium]|nr:DUF1566 domain-containing protein [Pseudomonadota bacterium]
MSKFQVIVLVYGVLALYVTSGCDDTYDETPELCWQNPAAVDIYSWEDSIGYCDMLEHNGKSDWRLPSPLEFKELLGDCEEDTPYPEYWDCNSCGESEECEEFFGSDENWYWTMQHRTETSSWGVDLGTGIVQPFFNEDGAYVRCVYDGSCSE